eukprot:COSAG01_NODE_435_length_17065_cov_46.870977_18_plen_233_part_00
MPHTETLTQQPKQLAIEACLIHPREEDGWHAHFKRSLRSTDYHEAHMRACLCSVNLNAKVRVVACGANATPKAALAQGVVLLTNWAVDGEPSPTPHMVVATCWQRTPRYFRCGPLSSTHRLKSPPYMYETRFSLSKPEQQKQLCNAMRSEGPDASGPLPHWQQREEYWRKRGKKDRIYDRLVNFACGSGGSLQLAYNALSTASNYEYKCKTLSARRHDRRNEDQKVILILQL